MKTPKAIVLLVAAVSMLSLAAHANSIATRGGSLGLQEITVSGGAQTVDDIGALTPPISFPTPTTLGASALVGTDTVGLAVSYDMLYAKSAPLTGTTEYMTILSHELGCGVQAKLLSVGPLSLSAGGGVHYLVPTVSLTATPPNASIEENLTKTTDAYGELHLAYRAPSGNWGLRLTLGKEFGKEPAPTDVDGLNWSGMYAKLGVSLAFGARSAK